MKVKKRLLRMLKMTVARKCLLHIAFFLLRLYLACLVARPSNHENFLAYLSGGGKTVVVVWHQRLLQLLAFKKFFTPLRPAAIISASRDGELLASFCSKLGARPLRGSSSYRGKEAMNSLVDDFKENNLALHALDGPTGPPGKIKAGIVRIAQKSGAVIFPLYLSSKRTWRVGSWDRMLIPKPFAVVKSFWGEPLSVPADLSSEGFEEQWREIEKILLRGQDAWDETCRSPFRLLPKTTA